MIGIFILLLIMCRVVGWQMLPLLFLTAALFVKPYSEKWFPWLLVLGVITDGVLGRRFGVTSLLLLLTYFELSLYKEKVDNASGWSVFFMSILVSAQTTVFWDMYTPYWMYLLNGILGMVFWFLQSFMVNKGFQGGVYLRKSF